MKRFSEHLKLSETIVRRGNKYVVMDKKKTRVLGTHDTLENAKKQLAAIEMSRHKRGE